MLTIRTVEPSDPESIWKLHRAPRRRSPLIAHLLGEVIEGPRIFFGVR